MLQVLNVPEKPVICFDGVGSSMPPLQYSFPQRYKDAYLQEMECFLSSVLDPSIPIPVTKRSVLLCSRIAEACEKSLKEGKMVTPDPIE